MNMKRLLNSISVFLFITSCGSLFTDPEPIYETAIRHYIGSWSALPNTLILSVEGEDPSENLLSRLDNLNTCLFGKEAARGLDFSNIEPGTYRDLSIRNIRWRGLNRVILEVSYSSTTPEGHMDAHGVEYLLQKKEAEWVVVQEGVEWIT
jgi:hypothetical protein